MTIDIIKQYVNRVDMLMNSARNVMSKSNTTIIMNTHVLITENDGTLVFGFTCMNFGLMSLSLLTRYKILV
jgi:hypothetical protein